MGAVHRPAMALRACTNTWEARFPASADSARDRRCGRSCSSVGRFEGHPLPGRCVARTEEGLLGLGPRANRLAIVCLAGGLRGLYRECDLARRQSRHTSLIRRNTTVTKSFNEELIEMLNKAGIEYEPKYLDSPSAATPPGSSNCFSRCDPVSPGYRCTRPGANGFDPSGVTCSHPGAANCWGRFGFSCHHPGGMPAISRWWRSLSDATTGHDAQYIFRPRRGRSVPGCDLSEVVDLPTRTPRVARRDPGLMALTPPGSHAVIPVRPIAGDASGSHVIIPAGCQPLAGGGGASATPPPVTMRNPFSDPNGVAALPGCDLSEVVDLPTRTPRVARPTRANGFDPSGVACSHPGAANCWGRFGFSCHHPGGMPAISRWWRSLSDATTGHDAQYIFRPQRGRSASGLRPLRGRRFADPHTPGRAARPGANGFDPSGVACSHPGAANCWGRFGFSCHHPGGMPAISRWWRSLSDATDAR